MTGRQAIFQRTRYCGAVIMSGLGLIATVVYVAATLLIRAESSPEASDLLLCLVFMAIPICGGIGAVILGYNRQSCRCPFCRGDLASPDLTRRIRAGKVDYCPYCGKSLDDEIPAKGKHSLDDLA